MSVSPRHRLHLSLGDSYGYEETSFDLGLVLCDWMEASGGTGPDVVHPIRVALVNEISGTGVGEAGKQQ